MKAELPSHYPAFGFIGCAAGSVGKERFRRPGIFSVEAEEASAGLPACALHSKAFGPSRICHHRPPAEKENRILAELNRNEAQPDTVPIYIRPLRVERNVRGEIREV
jgi:hypothetical protein